jgi:hypothetical protein
MNMGIIAEDDSDVAVMRELTLAILKPHRIGFKRFVGNGCGKLRRKCGAWAVNLAKQGCPWVAVVHDLDNHAEGELRRELTEAINPARLQASVVLLPKREIESWLLYDAAAIADAFNARKLPRLPGNPESLNDPKRFLGDLVWKQYRKDYLNTVHNELIAHRIDISTLGRSLSFFAYPGFVNAIKRKLR